MDNNNEIVRKEFIYQEGNLCFKGFVNKNDNVVERATGMILRIDENNTLLSQLILVFAQEKTMVEFVLEDTNKLSDVSSFAQKLITVINNRK